jgi:hypothetical protein
MLGKYIPSSLKGNFKEDKYFEGWFQKVYSKKHKSSFIIIYGYATRNSYDTFGFIQVLIPNENIKILYFPKSEISCDPNRHIIRMGNNMLTTELIRINSSNLNIHLNLSNNQPIQTFKNSMGYTYFIPNLPCYHSVMNSSHVVAGKIFYNDVRYTLDNEIGYLEKNWGTSFPETYFWLHAVDPTDRQVSLLFSRAEIKWLGQKFIKHIGHFHFDGKEIDLRDLKHFSYSSFMPSPENQILRITSKAISLEISILYRKKVKFKGPKEGQLSRDIYHYTDALINVCLIQNQKTRLFQLIGNFEDIGTF